MKLLNLFNWVESLVGFFTLSLGGGGSSGGGGGSQTSTSYSTNLPEYAKPYYEQLLKETGKQVYSTDSAGNVTGVQPYTPYTGARLAGFTPGQETVQKETLGMKTPGQFAPASTGLGTGSTLGLTSGLAGLTGAMGYTPLSVGTSTFSPTAAAYYADPYQKGVTDIAVREAERQRDLARTGRMTGAIGRGTFGGARQALADVEAERAAAQNIADIRAKGAESGYLNAQKMFEADQARRLQAAQLSQQGQQYAAGLGKELGMAGLTTGIEAAGKTGALAATEQTANLERLKAQAASAGEKQALQQEIDNIKYQQFQEQQNYQKAQLDYLSQILRGNAAALGTTQVQYAPAPSLASQLGGLGLAGLGLYNILGKQ